MVDFKQIYLEIVGESLTIPPNKADTIEEELRKKIPAACKHGDRLVRWYRLERKIAEKHGTDSDAAARAFLDNLGNLLDSLKVYDMLLDKAKRSGKINAKFEATDANGKTLELNPKTFLDMKYVTYRQAESFITQFGRIVDGDTAVDSGTAAGAEKYAIQDEDRKNIRLVGQNGVVCVWVTKGFNTTNKLVFQLWQNAKTMPNCDAYGDPETQSPYCTHYIGHWKNASKGDPEYQQYWYLKKLPYVAYVEGDLTNPGTVKTFNAMRGSGPETICALNDSNTCWNDRNDSPDQFGDDGLIDTMVGGGKYDFNRCGESVRQLYHAVFKVTWPQVEPQYQIDTEERRLVLNTKINAETRVISDNAVQPLQGEFYDSEYLDDSHFSLDTYTSDSSGDRLAEFENGKIQYPMVKEIKCLNFNVDMPLDSLENFPERIVCEDTSYGGNFIIQGPVESLKGCPNYIGGELEIDSCNQIKNLDGLSGYAYSFHIDCPDSLESLAGLENLQVEYHVTIDNFKFSSLEHMPKPRSAYKLDITFEGQQVTSLVGLPSRVVEINFCNASYIKSLTGLPNEAESYVFFDDEDNAARARELCLYDIYRCVYADRGVFMRMQYEGFTENPKYTWIQDTDQNMEFTRMAADARYKEILTRFREWYRACIANEGYYTQRDDLFPEMTEEETRRVIQLFCNYQKPYKQNIIKDIDCFMDSLFGRV